MAEVSFLSLWSTSGLSLCPGILECTFPSLQRLCCQVDKGFLLILGDLSLCSQRKDPWSSLFLVSSWLGVIKTYLRCFQPAWTFLVLVLVCSCRWFQVVQIPSFVIFTSVNLSHFCTYLPRAFSSSYFIYLGIVSSHAQPSEICRGGTKVGHGLKHLWRSSTFYFIVHLLLL